MAVNGKTIIDESTLLTIANAIRAKTGKTDTMTPAEMVVEIGTIGKLQPFGWSWNYAISNISIGADYVDQSETYGDNLFYLALGASKITLTNITTASNLVNWIGHLPDGGTAVVLVNSGLLTDDEKSAITAKGYTIEET